MREISDDFLLNMAEVSAALIGLFMAGIFFFADTGFRRLDQARRDRRARLPGQHQDRPCARCPPARPLARPGRAAAGLEPGRVRAAEPRCSWRPTWTPPPASGPSPGSPGRPPCWSTSWRARPRSLDRRPPVDLGGLHPTREDLAWAILLSFAAGFASISALVLFVLDVAGFEAGGGTRGRGSVSPAGPRHPRRLGQEPDGLGDAVLGQPGETEHQGRRPPAAA